MEYTCNLSGNKFTVKDIDKHREGANVFGLNSRMRAIIYVLIKTFNHNISYCIHLNIYLKDFNKIFFLKTR